MTTFTAPLFVKPGDSQTTAAVVEASGTATFSKVFIGQGSAGVQGTGLVVKRATVGAINSASNAIAINIPSGSDIIDYLVDVEIPFSPGALATAAEFSILHGASLVTNVTVSASGRYDAIDDGTKTNTALLRNVTSTVHAFVSTQSLASALTLGQAMLSVFYVPN